MKKIIAIALSVLAFAAVVSAQPRALGVRFGGAGVNGFGYGAELSYQHTGGPGFLEVDLGWSSVGINGTLAWDCIFASVDNFNFYIGPGVNAGLYDAGDKSTAFNLGVVGQLGAEYQFGTIPFNISLDWRPAFYVLPGTHFSPFGAALAFRYRF